MGSFLADTTYEIELSADNTFQSGVMTNGPGTRTQAFSNLNYDTRYYVRILSSASPNFGPTRSFTTITMAQACVVVVPMGGAIRVSWNPMIKVNPIVGASSYTVELSKLADFGEIDFTQTGPTPNLPFTGLDFATRYYARATCDLLPGVFGPTRSFTTNTPLNYTVVTSPLQDASNVSYLLTIMTNPVPGATTYIIEVDTQIDFLSGSSMQNNSSMPKVPFLLAENTTYFARVKTNLLDQFGAVRSFSTGNLLSITHVTSPRDGGMGVPTSVNVYSRVVPGASSYTIELNTSPAFNGVSFVKTSSKNFMKFTGLSMSTTYYTRVMTNMDPNWGTTHTFFETAIPAGRSGSDWMGYQEEEELVDLGPFEVKIMGNPFRDRLSFIVSSPNWESAAVGLYDMMGKSMHQSVEKTNQMIDIEKQLTRGIYILKVRTASGSKSVRVMKED
jgi:Secretion system C-terminal sorting domain